jgi:outer membrane immunogenic protein
MRTKYWSGIGVLASIVAGVGAAGAADLATKAPVYTKAPPPVILSDWAGFYIGAHGGGGWNSSSFNDIFGNSYSAKPSGGLGGGHVGYNWQWGQVVAGFEGDFDGASINGTDTLGVVGVKTDELASIRGRLGYSFVPNVLAYGTAGVGFGHTQFTWLDGLAPNESIWQTGWVAGGGLEYKFTPNWILRAEYLHYGFDSGSTNSFSTIKNDLDVVRGGVSYKF